MGEWDVVGTREVGGGQVSQSSGKQSVEDGGFNVVGSRPISTITGQQIPTGEESGEQAKSGVKSIVRGAGPIVGDIALTALAPQISLPLKAGKLAKAGIFGANTLIRALASAGGSAGGAKISDVATDQEVDEDRVKQEAVLGAGGEIATTALAGITKGAGKILKPIFEVIPDITFSGAAVKKAYNKKYRQEATDRAEAFLLDVAPESVKKAGSDANNNLNVMINEAFSDNSGVYDLYKGALDDAAAKEGGQVFLDDTAQMIGDLFETAKNSFPDGATKLQIMNEALRPFNFTPNVKQALAELSITDITSPKHVQFLLATVFQNKGWNKLNPTQQAIREELKETIMADIDKLVVGGVGDIKKAADKEFKALIKFNTIKRIYDKSMTKAGETRILSPGKLHEQIFANKKRILADPELSKLWPALEKEAIAALEASKNILKTDTDVGPGSIFSRGLGPAAGTFVAGKKGGVIAESIGAATAWALLSDPEKSLLKKLFKSSSKLARPGTKAGIHLAGQEVIFGDNSDDPGI